MRQLDLLMWQWDCETGMMPVFNFFDMPVSSAKPPTRKAGETEFPTADEADEAEKTWGPCYDPF